jgi:hypothetical protein
MMHVAGGSPDSGAGDRPDGRFGPQVSQIESGDVSTHDCSSFVAALGGTLKLIPDFGDEQLKIA